MVTRFKVGQKVVCNTAPWGTKVDGFVLPRPWEVHTVKETYDTEGLQLIWLSHATNYPALNANHFRPLHDEISEAIIAQVGGYPKNIR